MPHRVENIVRKGEIACYKQLLLFTQVFHTFNASKCGIVWLWDCTIGMFPLRCQLSHCRFSSSFENMGIHHGVVKQYVQEKGKYRCKILH